MTAPPRTPPGRFARETSPVVRYHATCTECDWEHYSRRHRTAGVRRENSTRAAALTHVRNHGHVVSVKRIEVMRPT